MKLSNLSRIDKEPEIKQVTGIISSMFCVDYIIPDRKAGGGEREFFLVSLTRNRHKKKKIEVRFVESRIETWEPIRFNGELN